MDQFMKFSWKKDSELAELFWVDHFEFLLKKIASSQWKQAARS